MPAPVTGRVQIFTDGAARYSACPVARLTYWAVVMSSLQGSPAECEAWRQRPCAERAATFRVLVQGCTPGSQTVPRAELSALAWVARWLRQSPSLEADVFTDSSYVVSIWNKVRQHQSVSAIRSDTDLAMELLHCPGLHVWKVKAHASGAEVAAATARDAWRFAGNAAADSAARGAKALELSYMTDLADTLFEDYSYQLDHLLVFCKYLIDVNVADIRFKEAEEDTIQLCHESLQPVTGYNVPCWSGRARGCPHHRRPKGQLWMGRGARTSCAPCADGCGPWNGRRNPGQSNRTWRVRTLPPTVIQASAARVYVNSLDPMAVMQPRSLASFVGTFQSLLHIAKMRPRLLPALKVTGIPYLRALGLRPLQSGIDRHPRFPPACNWTPLLAEVCRLNCYQPLVAHVNALSA